MAVAPRVAVTTAIEDARPGRATAVTLGASYLAALEREHMTPVLLTPAHSPDAVAALLAICDGLVLTGGADVDPARFGATPHPALGSVVPERDALEWHVLELALQRNLPVLGICRGCQVLNVYLGGTLYQDLPAELPGALAHEQAGGWSEHAHEVRIAEDSRLRDIVGSATLSTNSFHHQSARDVAPALRAVAVSEDGVIEALESREHAWVVGVQWHPERGPAERAEDDPDRRLLRAFRDAVLRHGA